MYVDVEGIAYTFDGCLVKAILAYKTKPDEKIPCGRRWATHMLEYVQGRTGAEWAYIAESAKCVYLANGNVHKFVPVQHLLPDGVYSNKVKFCVAQCIEFQREKYTWCPARPCCLPNLWLRPRQAPSRHQMLPCFFKLDQEQKQQFRAFVGSPEAKRWKSFESTAAMRRWLRLLHPERALLQEANGGDLEQLKIRNGQMKKVRRRLWSGSVMLQTPTRPTEVVDLETSHQAAQPVREPRGTRRDVDRHVGNRGLVPGAERRAAKRIEGLGPEGTSRGKVTLRQGLKELPEKCAQDLRREEGKHKHLKTYRSIQRAARLLQRAAVDAMKQKLPVQLTYKLPVQRAAADDVKQKLPLQLTYKSPLQRAALEVVKRKLPLQLTYKLPVQRAAADVVKQKLPARRRPEMRGLEQVAGAGSSSGALVAKPGGNCKNDPSKFPGHAQLRDTSKAEASGSALVTTVRAINKQSGVRGVWWDSQSRCWMVSKRCVGQRSHELVGISKYLEAGMSEAEAMDAALREAIAFRRGLEASCSSRVGDPPKARPANKAPATKGVTWHKQNRCWHVQMTVRYKKFQQYFKPKDRSPEEVEKARLLAVEHRRALEERYLPVQVAAADSSGTGGGLRTRQAMAADSSLTGGRRRKQRLVAGNIPAGKRRKLHVVAARLSAGTQGKGWRKPEMKGVYWNKRNCAWAVILNIQGRLRYFGCFRPEDDSPEEVEKARLLAVARCRAMEQQQPPQQQQPPLQQPQLQQPQQQQPQQNVGMESSTPPQQPPLQQQQLQKPQQQQPQQNVGMESSTPQQQPPLQQPQLQQPQQQQQQQNVGMESSTPPQQPPPLQQPQLQQPQQQPQQNVGMESSTPPQQQPPPQQPQQPLQQPQQQPQQNVGMEGST